MRACSLACCAAAFAALGVLGLAPAAGASTLGGTYLALGDSLTYGYHQAQFQEELSKGAVNPASFNDGFVDDFGAVLKLANPKLQVINDGCPGETSDTFIKGPGFPGPFCAGGPTGAPFPYVFLHHPYTTGSQLSDALAILESNHNVSPISLDIGANDVLQFLEHTLRLPGQIVHRRTDRGRVLSHRHQRRVDPRTAARGRPARADRRDRQLQPLPDGDSRR